MHVTGHTSPANDGPVRAAEATSSAMMMLMMMMKKIISNAEGFQEKLFKLGHKNDFEVKLCTEIKSKSSWTLCVYLPEAEKKVCMRTAFRVVDVCRFMKPCVNECLSARQNKL